MDTKIFMYCLMCFTMVAQAVADDHAGFTKFDMKPGIKSSMSPCLERKPIVLSLSHGKEHSLLIERPVDCTEKVHYQVLNNGKGMSNCGSNGANNNTFVLPSDDVLGDECSRKCTDKYDNHHCRSISVKGTFISSNTGNEVDVVQEIKVFFNKEHMVVSSLVSGQHIVDPTIVKIHLELACRVGEEGKVYKPYDPCKVCCGLVSGDEAYQTTIQSLSFEDKKDWYVSILHRGVPANPVGTALEWRKQGKYCFVGFFPVDIPTPADKTVATCLTEETCEEVAKSLGLKVGGKGYPFAGPYYTKGLYAYSNGKYAGMAFYGTGGTTEAQMTNTLSPPVFRPEQAVNSDRGDVQIKAKITAEVTERNRRRNNHLEKNTATPSPSRTLQVEKFIKISRVYGIANNNTNFSHVTRNNYTTNSSHVTRNNYTTNSSHFVIINDTNYSHTKVENDVQGGGKRCAPTSSICGDIGELDGNEVCVATKNKNSCGKNNQFDPTTKKCSSLIATNSTNSTSGGHSATIATTAVATAFALLLF